jgi:hypothetical protein
MLGNSIQLPLLQQREWEELPRLYLKGRSSFLKRSNFSHYLHFYAVNF